MLFIIDLRLIKPTATIITFRGYHFNGGGCAPQSILRNVTMASSPDERMPGGGLNNNTIYKEDTYCGGNSLNGGDLRGHPASPDSVAGKNGNILIDV